MWKHWLILGWTQQGSHSRWRQKNPLSKSTMLTYGMAHDGNRSLSTQPATQYCCQSKWSFVSTKALGLPRSLKTSITNSVRLRKRSYQKLTSTAISPALTQITTPLPKGRTTLHFKYSAVLEETIKTTMLWTKTPGNASTAMQVSWYPFQLIR